MIAQVKSKRWKLIKNSFQNVERSRERFDDLSFDPFSGVGESDLKLFRALLAARHVVGHNLSVVDDKYLESGGSGRVGEPLGLDKNTIESFAEIAISIILHTARSFRELSL